MDDQDNCCWSLASSDCRFDFQLMYLVLRSTISLLSLSFSISILDPSLALSFSLFNNCILSSTAVLYLNPTSLKLASNASKDILSNILFTSSNPFSNPATSFLLLVSTPFTCSNILSASDNLVLREDSCLLRSSFSPLDSVAIFLCSVSALFNSSFNMNISWSLSWRLVCWTPFIINSFQSCLFRSQRLSIFFRERLSQFQISYSLELPLFNWFACWDVRSWMLFLRYSFSYLSLIFSSSKLLPSKRSLSLVELMFWSYFFSRSLYLLIRRVLLSRSLSLFSSSLSILVDAESLEFSLIRRS